MKCSALLSIAGLAVSAVLGSPIANVDDVAGDEAPGTSRTVLVPRANPKLNQYRTMADCQADRNILYHASPPSAVCYNIDGATGAIFINPGGFLLPNYWHRTGCSGWVDGAFQVYTGRCYDKGSIRSVRFE